MNKSISRTAVPKNKMRKPIITASIILTLFFMAWGIIAAKMPEPLNVKKLLSANIKNTSGYTKADIDYLNKIGFSKSSTVLSNTDLLDAETKEYVAKTYGLTYISKVFFNNNIVSKYNLIIAPKSRFTRSIPRKNVEELRANLEAIDKKDINNNQKQSNWIIALDRFQPENSIVEFVSEDDIRPDWVEGMKTNRLLGGRVQWVSQAMNPVPAKKYVEVYGDQIALVYLPAITGTVSDQNAPESDLVICAPKSYFDTDGLELSSDSPLEWVMPKPKDPIILKKYKEGYIILTAWEE